MQHGYLYGMNLLFRSETVDSYRYIFDLKIKDVPVM
jgi:hypothetical protein